MLRRLDYTAARDGYTAAAWPNGTLEELEARRERRRVQNELLEAEDLLREYGLPVPPKGQNHG